MTPGLKSGHLQIVLNKFQHLDPAVSYDKNEMTTMTITHTIGKPTKDLDAPLNHP